MDKRSWPWKKKSSEKLLTEGLEPVSVLHPAKYSADHDAPTSLPDQTLSHIAEAPKDCREHELKIRDLNEKILSLNEKLSAALSDVASKESLVKQHTKVAEEAVSGWEKAETEAANLKQQLDTAFQQKLALEDRVSHLDGALKECMRQLRHAREQQEENIHDAIVKKTRDWDRVRSELEEKLADVEQRFMERDAECQVMSKTLQERARIINDLSEACSKAETDLNLVRIRLETSEKEKMGFKYELHLSQKELEIRNEEKLLSKKAADAANKQHLEDIKKISKLEAECQRLQVLVRKRLSGPAALAQMRYEVEGPRSKKADSSRKRAARPDGSPKTSPAKGEIQDDDHEDKESGRWLDRFSSLEEETKMLREALAKKTNELQSARVMCAKTASKLSTVEQQLEALTNNQSSVSKVDVMESIRSLSNSVEPSLASASEDGNDGEASCAESWATALIVELDHFKKGKPGEKNLEALKAELDDFMEMEQLASISPTSASPVQDLRKAWQEKGSAERRLSSMSLGDVPLQPTPKDTGVPDVRQLYEEVSAKLSAAEEELASWKQKSDANQANMLDLKEKLNLLFEARDANADLDKVIDEIKRDMGISTHSLENLRKQIRRLSQDTNNSECVQKTRTPSDLACEEGESSDADSEMLDIGSGMSSIICDVVQLVEQLVDSQVSARSHREARNTDIIATCQKLIEVKNRFLHRKAELTELMTELSGVLKHLLKLRVEDSRASTPMTRKTFSWGSSIHTSGEMEFSGVGSPISDTSKSDCSEEAAKIVPTDDSSLHLIKKECLSLEVTRLEEDLKRAVSEKMALEEELRKALSERDGPEEELRKVRSEKLALETHMRTEFARFSNMEQELAQVKLDKAEADFALNEAKSKLEELNAQLNESERLVDDLEQQLTSVQSSKQHGDDQLCLLSALKDESDSQLRQMSALKDETDLQLKACRAELIKLQDRIEKLSMDVSNEQKKNADLEAKCKDLQEQLHEKSNYECPRCVAAANEEAERIKKEQEIAAAAAKLAECQQTILALGQQIKALSSPDRSMQRSLVVDKFSSERYPSSRCHSTTFGDGVSEAGSSARFADNEDNFRGPRNRRELSWDPRDSIASDVLDSELLSLSMQGQNGGRKMYDMFGDKVPAHEDYIEAVAQMPSSPEAEPASPKRSIPKPPYRKKKNPRSFAGIAGIDLSKSMGDSTSPSAEKHTSFVRFFSRSKHSN